MQVLDRMACIGLEEGRNHILISSRGSPMIERGLQRNSTCETAALSPFRRVLQVPVSIAFPDVAFPMSLFFLQHV